MASLCIAAALSAVLLYGGCPYADAVVLSAAPKNQSTSRVNAGVSAVGAASPDRLEASQTRVDRVNGRPASTDDHVATGKDYDGRYPVHNTYGPPRDDYYYDERPTDHRFGPSQAGYQPPGDEVYQHYPPHVPEHHQYFQQHHSDGGGGEGYRPGELNIQPLLLPLAGITLLSVLSALVKAPLLLHLGTVGRRRRREVATVHDRDFTTAQTIRSLLKQFGDRKRRHVSPQSCLVCDIISSIYDRHSSCVEWSVCEVMSRNGSGGADMDKQLLSAMIAQIVENDQMPEEIRKRLETAEVSGRNAANCGQLYPCASDDGVPGTKRE